MIEFAAIIPHPPIIIPGIGRPEDLKSVKNTVSAMEKLGRELKKIRPETILLISPHAPVNPDSFALNSAEKLSGDLLDFGLDSYSEFENDLLLAEKIQEAAQAEKIKTGSYQGRLDHGALIPLYYLAKKFRPKLVHLSLSLMDLGKHYQYGQIIGKVCKDAKKKIALVASGDLSHCLTPGAPAGYSPRGREFDQKLISLLESKDIEGIINLDPDLIEQAGQCGLKSIIILLGALEKWNFNLLSYEGPFGVGYLAAQLH